MSYKYPERITVGGLTYTVKLHNKYSLDKMGDTAGLHCVEHTSIDLATMAENGEQRSLDRLNHNLWHELVHSINQAWILGLGEDDVDRMAQGITQILNQQGIQLITL